MSYTEHLKGGTGPDLSAYLAQAAAKSIMARMDRLCRYTKACERYRLEFGYSYIPDLMECWPKPEEWN